MTDRIANAGEDYPLNINGTVIDFKKPIVTTQREHLDGMLRFNDNP
jgi:hypothetical protein